MRDMIYDWAVRIIQRKHIGSIRKRKHRKKRTAAINVDNARPAVV